MDEIIDNYDGNFWNQKYEKEDTPWNIMHISPPLKSYIDQLIKKDIKILIPGSGHAHEAFYLLEQGFSDVTICDFSDVAMSKLKRIDSSNQLNLVIGDFFELKGKFDLIIEQTFFCALIPTKRKNYIEKTYELLNDGGKLVGVLFDRPFNHDGPPFGGTKKEYEGYFSKKFNIKKMEKCYNSVGARLGYELFFICLR